MNESVGASNLWFWIPLSVRRLPRYKSDTWHPMPVIGLRGDAGWKRGDLGIDEFVLSDEIETDEPFVNIDDAVDDDERFVNGPSAYPLPIKPLRLIGDAKL